MTKRTVMLILALITAGGSLFAEPSGRKVQAVFEGETLKPVKLYSFSNDEFLSVKDIARVYGSDLVYHPVSGKVALMMNNRRLDIYIKSTRLFYGKTKKRLSVPTRYIGGEVYVPASLVISKDFASFSETKTSFNTDAGILTVEKKVNVLAPRFYSKRDATVLVIELLDALNCEVQKEEGNELVVSIPRGRLVDDKVSVNDGVVKTLTMKIRGRTAIIAASLDAGAGSFEKKILDNPRRIQIAIARTSSAGALPAADVVPSTLPESSAEIIPPLEVAPLSETAVEASSSAAVSAAPAVSTVTVPAKAAQPAARHLVILDAGHGGDDPGAIGPSGTKEKDINLLIVYELKRLFEEDGEYDVVLTRTDDTFIPLVERTSLANEKKADLFVSVHCNANLSRSVTGFEIYFLSETASDPEAAATAILENSVVRLEGKPNKKRARLQELLWSLTMNEFINESSELCSFITSEVTRRTKIENRGVKQAGFFVLRGAQMPAVLVESAFLSNYGEEAKLKGKKFQQGVADAIYEGVRKFDLRRYSVNAKK